MNNDKNNKNSKDKWLDSDADGLSDKEEKRLGTDPFNRDSDQDGLGDYEEVNIYGTDPLNPDTDFDGLPDGDEVRLGLNPRGPGKLKDLFIPHRGNDYKPHALHPKRLLFYSLSSVLIKALVIIFVLVMPMAAWLTPDVLRSESLKIIELTNTVRSNLGLGLLEENSRLTQAAVDKAQDMIVNQYFAHVGPDKKAVSDWIKGRGYNYSVAGENLALGFTDAQDVVNAWTKSPTHYANMIDADFSEIGAGMVSGVYNNYETSLAAQYFAAPKSVQAASTPAVPAAEVKPEPTAPEKKPIAEAVKEEKAPLASPLQPAVEAEKQTNTAEEPEVIKPVVQPVKTEPLAAPQLIYPVSGLVTKESQIQLNILAPGAEEVIVYSFDNKLAETAGEPESGYLNLTVRPGQGLHELRIEAIKGRKKISSPEYLLMIDNTAPTVDLSRTRVIIDSPDNREEKIVKAVAYLSPDTVEAEVNLGNYRLNLKNNSEEPNKWEGELIIFEKENQELLNPVVLASLHAQDRAGNNSVTDIEWQDITPVNTSLLNQYLFLRSHPSEHVKPLFDLSSVYYKILLALAVALLAVNILVEIKKQHPHIIASTVGLIGLLAFLILI